MPSQMDTVFMKDFYQTFNLHFLVVVFSKQLESGMLPQSSIYLQSIAVQPLDNIINIIFTMLFYVNICLLKNIFVPVNASTTKHNHPCHLIHQLNISIIGRFLNSAPDIMPNTFRNNFIFTASRETYITISP